MLIYKVLKLSTSFKNLIGLPLSEKEFKISRGDGPDLYDKVVGDIILRDFWIASGKTKEESIAVVNRVRGYS